MPVRMSVSNENHLYLQAFKTYLNSFGSRESNELFRRLLGLKRAQILQTVAYIVFRVKEKAEIPHRTAKGSNDRFFAACMIQFFGEDASRFCGVCSHDPNNRLFETCFRLNITETNRAISGLKDIFCGTCGDCFFRDRPCTQYNPQIGGTGSSAPGTTPNNPLVIAESATPEIERMIATVEVSDEVDQNVINQAIYIGSDDEGDE